LNTPSTQAILHGSFGIVGGGGRFGRLITGRLGRSGSSGSSGSLGRSGIFGRFTFTVGTFGK